MAKLNVDLDNKPHLNALLKSDKQKGLEVLQTFLELAEEACEYGWVDLPQLLAKELTFSDLVKGILHGSLDLKDINPEAYPVLKEEVHPLSMLMNTRPNHLEGGIRYFDWRYHFRLEPGTPVNQETVASIFRKLLRYSKYVPVDKLAQALLANQIKTFEGLGVRAVEMLPMIPALRYQKANFGDLHVGKFFDEVGFLDCGHWVGEDDEYCPACQHPNLHKYGVYRLCLACNAGFREAVL